MGYLSFSCRVESAVSTSNSLTPSPSFSSSSTITTSKKQNNKEKEKPIKIQHFHYSDLEAAINGFSERKLLGKRSHGYVYKSVMVSSSSSFVSAPEFIINNNEVDILSKIQSSKLPNWGRRVHLALQTTKEIDTLHSSTPPVIQIGEEGFVCPKSRAITASFQIGEEGFVWHCKLQGKLIPFIHQHHLGSTEILISKCSD